MNRQHTASFGRERSSMLSVRSSRSESISPDDHPLREPRAPPSPRSELEGHASSTPPRAHEVRTALARVATPATGVATGAVESTLAERWGHLARLVSERESQGVRREGPRRTKDGAGDVTASSGSGDVHVAAVAGGPLDDAALHVSTASSLFEVSIVDSSLEDQDQDQDHGRGQAQELEQKPAPEPQREPQHEHERGDVGAASVARMSQRLSASADAAVDSGTSAAEADHDRESTTGIERAERALPLAVPSQRSFLEDHDEVQCATINSTTPALFLCPVCAPTSSRDRHDMFCR